RASQTVSYDVTVTNIGRHDLLLPVVLELDPRQQFEGVPLTAQGQSPDGTWLIDLSSQLEGGLLRAGASTVGKTITVRNPAARRVTFDPSVTGLPAPNQAPAFLSRPAITATAGQALRYQAVA